MAKKVLVVGDSAELNDRMETLNTKLDGNFNLHLMAREDFISTPGHWGADMIILDAAVLEPNRKKTLQEIQSKSEDHQPPILLLTSDPDKELLPGFLEQGANDYLLKPFDEKQLFHRLRAVEKKMEAQKNKAASMEAPFTPSMDLEAESTNNAVIQLKPDGTVEWVNEGFEHIYEYTLEEYLEDFRHYIFSPNSKGFQLALEKFENGEKGLTFEHQIQTRLLDQKWLQTTLTPIFSEEGTLKNVIVVETDITQLYHDKQKTEQLLANLFPHEITEQLKRKGRAKSKKYRMVTVLFADFENFTALTKSMSVDELITELNRYVRRFDEIIDDHYLEKIKTIGDAYMCAGGLPLKNYSNPFDVTLASLRIQQFVREMAEEKMTWGEHPWKLRIGIHTGRVMAGVIGTKKFAYDIWGDTVNIASRMEGSGQVGKVNISATTYDYIKDYFDCSYRGKLTIKNMTDAIDMYFVNRLKPEYSEDEKGIHPNAAFRKILSQY
jgi:class 3 adenylate cyclase/response regulator of citrate/malate metabolism